MTGATVTSVPGAPDSSAANSFRSSTTPTTLGPTTSTVSDTTTTRGPSSTSSSSTSSATTTTIEPSGSSTEFPAALSNPSAAGYPDASNTGVPRGTKLAKLKGTIDVRDEHLRFGDEVVATRPESGSVDWGPVTLYPDRTEMRRADLVGRLKQTSTLPIVVSGSKISATNEPTRGFYQVHTAGAPEPRAMVSLSDCTIWGGLGNAAAFGGWMEFVRCDISGGEDAIDMQSETHLRDCYIHDLERRPDSHNDVIQCGGAVNASIIHCTLLAARRVPDGQGLEFPDGWYDPMNAVLMIGDYGGEIRNVVVDDCLVDGGNYTFNDNWSNQYPVNNIVVRRNRFGRHFRFGPRSLEGDVWVWENNVWDDTGEPV